MAEQRTNWEQELQSSASLVEKMATKSIAVWAERWKGILDREIMHAEYSGKEATMVPGAQGLELQWTDKPLQDKVSDLSAMIDRLGARVDSMREHNEAQAMDAGWYVDVALSVQAAERRSQERSKTQGREQGIGY